MSSSSETATELCAIDAQQHSHIIDMLEELKLLTIKSVPSLPSKSLADLGLSATYFEVGERERTALIEEISELVLAANKAKEEGKNYCFTVPSRSKSNQFFIAELGRKVLGSKTRLRCFKNKKTKDKAEMTLHALTFILGVLRDNVSVSMRTIFYSYKRLFISQRKSDDIIDDICCMLRCTRSSLLLYSLPKGLVRGPLTYVDTEQGFISCLETKEKGELVPSDVTRVTDLQSDALFILLVEKETIFIQLVEYQFHTKYRCIIITGKGQPDIATREFLNKLTVDLGLPVMGLMDCDPHGLQILSIYKYGSDNLAFESHKLVTPNIKWLGLRPNDLKKYNLLGRLDVRRDMRRLNTRAIETGAAMLKAEFMESNEEWKKELQLMIETKWEVDAGLLSLGYSFLAEQYVPTKLKKKDWI